MALARRSRVMGNLVEGAVLITAATALLAALMWAARHFLPSSAPASGDDTQAIVLAGQVVPATVVAVFVFAIGAVFVIAQIIIPSRGARAASVLFRFLRTRLALAWGAILLLGSLVLAGSIFFDEAGPRDWQAGLAVALLVSSGLYLVLATWLLATVLAPQISPRAFAERLVKPPRRWRLLPWRGRWDAESLFWSLRVFRGWIRTVNRIGESRDLHFALDGLLDLAKRYASQVREELAAGTGGRSPLRDDAPADHRATRSSAINTLSDDDFGPRAPPTGRRRTAAGPGPARPTPGSPASWGGR